jgi:LmbE family N-acetylglucosaminyl deacetylase
MAGVFDVISPHLDDAALSCCLFLAANPGSHITTVFADGPASVRPLTPWDRAARCFAEGADVMRARRAEDARAAALIHATTSQLPFWDRQYRNDHYGYRGCADDELVAAIAENLLHRGRDLAADGLVLPLGLGHPDHRLAAEAGLIVAAQEPGRVLVYEELPYAVEKPAEAAEQKRRLVQRGFTLEPDPALEFLDDRHLKRAVFRCHASQRRQLRWRARKAFRAQERLWRLVRC